MKKENIVVKNQVILNAIQDLQRLPLQLLNNMRGRFQIKFGMTTLFNDGGFTLIELLVVVLIIGILAAVAVPQYQKAVMKSRYNTLKNLTKSIFVAQHAYYLANGKYTEELEDLDIKLSGGYYNDSSPRRYIYPWGYCEAKIAETTNRLNISCVNNNIGMGYNSIPESKLWQCYVFGSADPKDYPIQNSICQAETGLSKRSGVSSSADPKYVRWNYPGEF